MKKIKRIARRTSQNHYQTIGCPENFNSKQMLNNYVLKLIDTHQIAKVLSIATFLLAPVNKLVIVLVTRFKANIKTRPDC